MATKAWRDLHISLGLCTKCCQPAIGGRRCPRHAYKSNVISSNYYKKHGAEMRERMRKNRDQYRLTGRCSTCSAPLTTDDMDGGLKSCVNCSSDLVRHHGANPYWRVNRATDNKGVASKL